MARRTVIIPYPKLSTDHLVVQFFPAGQQRRHHMYADENTHGEDRSAPFRRARILESLHALGHQLLASLLLKQEPKQQPAVVPAERRVLGTGSVAGIPVSSRPAVGFGSVA